jgi:hypothetical protein
MFHHTRDAIEAHLTIVFAALAVARHLQENTGLSVRKIIQTLRPLQQISVRIAGPEHVAHDPLTTQAQEILHALNINRTNPPQWHESGLYLSKPLLYRHCRSVWPGRHVGPPQSAV